MRKLVVSIILIVLLLVGWFSTHIARGAEPARPIRIGALTSSWGPTPQVAGLRDRLLELGYRENDDFVIGVRFTQGNLAALPTAARELVQHGADLILAAEEQQATSQVPIVFTSVSNPVELGLVKSFARPGGNITGVSDLAPDLNPKRLELFLATVPALRRVLLPYDATTTLTAEEVKVSRQAARRLGIELIERAIRSQAEAQTVLAQIRKDHVDGILVLRCCSLNIPGYVLETTARQKIPAKFESAFWVEQGALVSYGPDYYASGKQAARLVDKIIKGATPGEIPVEVNTKIEFVINLETAKGLGLTIPPEVLYRADKIIR
jgi:putative ABC transport system substrate-binding protein